MDFKRPGLDLKYPKLCSFYDDYFYNIEVIKDKFESFDEDNGSKGFLDWQTQELRFSQFESKLGMTNAKQE